MSGSVNATTSQEIVNTAVILGILFGPVFLSGHCLHRVKCSSLKGARRYLCYGLFSLMGMIPVVLMLPLALVYVKEARVHLFLYWAAVTAALFGMLHYSPPNKRWLMFLPGVFAIAFFFFLLSLVDG